MRAARRSIMAVLATAALGMAADGAWAAPDAAITSPEEGAQVSRAASPQLELAGTAAFDTPAPATRRFYVRRTACNADQRLSTTRGSETGGCASGSSHTPLNEINRTPVDYDAENGVPLTLDASRAVTGVVTLTSNLAPVYVGIGRGTTVDVTVSAVVDGSMQALGSTSFSYDVLPGAPPVATPWSITPPAALDRKDVTGVRLTLVVRGINAQHGFVVPNDTNLTLPTYTASFARRVEVAVGNGPFAAATLADDLSAWTAQVATPAEGTHVISARAVQGTAQSPLARRTVVVGP